MEYRPIDRLFVVTCDGALYKYRVEDSGNSLVLTQLIKDERRLIGRWTSSPWVEIGMEGVRSGQKTDDLLDDFWSSHSTPLHWAGLFLDEGGARTCLASDQLTSFDKRWSVQGTEVFTRIEQSNDPVFGISENLLAAMTNPR